MRRRSQVRFEEFDWHLLAVALVLSLIGVVFVWSTTQGPDGESALVARQIAYIGVSLPLVAVLVRIPYPVLARLAVPAYVVALLLLVVLLLRTGGDVRQTQAWFRLPLGFSFQPSEFAKLAVILMIAAYLRFRGAPRRFIDLIGPFALTVFPLLLILRQPDLGGAVTLVPVVLAMVFAAGARGRLLMGLLACGALLAVAFYFSPFIKPYQRARIRAFTESIPERTEAVARLRAAGRHEEAREAEQTLRAIKQEGSFQVYHAMISIGSGGLVGKGIGKGPHNRLDFLPERHNDFIFAVVGEEWGFVGTSIVLWLSFLMAALILGIARRTRDAFGRLLCVGVATLFAFQTFLNTGVATGLLPVTGLTLPFLSAGGSSMVASFLAVAVVLNVGAHRVTVLDGATFDRPAIGEPAPRARARIGGR